jgi:flagellar basal-body rod protein FlgF
MENSAYIALSGQGALKRELSVIANNIANMNTTAYKKESMLFVEHLVKSKGQQSFAPPISYARDVAQYQHLNEGPIKQTGNPLDIAIPGQGYFVVDTDEGQRFTRNGHFNLNNEGKLVNLNNLALLSDAGTPFFFGPEDTNIVVTSEGLISSSNGPIGKIKIVNFDKLQNLQKEAGGLYSSEEQPKDIPKPAILQGALEGSNVNPISEITKMITVQRAYDNVKTFIDKEDARQKRMIQELTPRI